MSQLACLSCGACCARYRVSFYWAEASDQTSGGVPVELTEDLTPTFRCMKGTNQRYPRCIALKGEIGVDAYCSIYDHRPSVCREVPSLFDDAQSEQCLRARMAAGVGFCTGIAG